MSGQDSAESIVTINDLRVLSQANPYPLYARLRDQNPMGRATLPNGQSVWIVTGYEAAQAVVKDDRFGKDMRRRAGGKVMQMLLAQQPFRSLTQNMLRLDP